MSGDSGMESSAEAQLKASNDLLQELLAVAKSIQDSLNRNRVQESKEAQTEAHAHAEDSENLTIKDAIVETSTNLWQISGQVKEFQRMSNSYISGCKKIGRELDFLIAHYRIVGQINNIVKVSEHLREIILDTSDLQRLAAALLPAETVTFKEMYESIEAALQGVQVHLGKVSPNVKELHGSLRSRNDEKQVHNVKKWENFCSDGHEKIKGFLEDRDIEACLEYLNNELFNSLEKVIQDVANELSSLERVSVNAWLASEKISEVEQWYKKYINHVSSLTNPPSTTFAWSNKEIQDFRKRCIQHREKCEKMDGQLLRLIVHYEHVGGDKEVVRASRFLLDKLHTPMKTIEWYLSRNSSDPALIQESLTETVHHLGCLHFAAYDFQRSLYRQEHAFYFHDVEQWVTHLWSGWREIFWFIRDGNLAGCLQYMLEELFGPLEAAIGGIDKELEKFREKSLPSFLAEEKDRDASLYVSITGIATFFSSVTATTLQFSFAQSDSTLGAAVNLFWFLSLVFSVSSGISSLLGLTWRKSSIYHTSMPPKPVRLWLDKAPMLFLIIAAFAFIVGLNLFAFLSSQPLSVSLTTITVTALHILGLFFVIAWYILELKQNNIIAKWILHPYQQYKSDLQLQREIYWAFGNDKEVGRLTSELSPWIEKTRRNPYMLSKTIWRLRSSLKGYSLRVKTVPYAFRDVVIRTIDRFLPHRRLREDAETGAGGPNGEKGPSNPLSEAEEVKNEFRKSLEDKFGKTGLVDEVMQTIGFWENPYVKMSDELEERLKLLLWGYPKLVYKVDKEVLVRLRGIREQKTETDARGTNNGPPEILHAYNIRNRRESGLLPLEVYYTPGASITGMTDLQTLALMSESHEQTMSQGAVQEEAAMVPTEGEPTHAND